MDWNNIYSDFIADRRLKDISPDACIERHHIIPRCMGGLDTPENMIDLEPEDHFFAHLVLAKAHKLPKLWAAVKIMAEKAGGNQSKLTMVRRMYGIAKRTFILMNSGANHYKYDHTVYDFISKTGLREKCTRFELCTKYNVCNVNLSTVIKGRAKTVEGWTLWERTQEEGFFWGRGGGENSPKADMIRRRWRGRNGEEFEGTNVALAAKYRLRAAGLAYVTRGTAVTSQGWCLAANHDAFPTRSIITQPTRPTMILKHIDGRTVQGTRQFISAEIHLNANEISRIVKGRRKSVEGWMLFETDPDTIIREKTSKYSGIVKHPELGFYEGNASVFAKRFFEGSESANAYSGFRKLIQGKSLEWRGWVLVSSCS